MASLVILPENLSFGVCHLQLKSYKQPEIIQKG